MVTVVDASRLVLVVVDAVVEEEGEEEEDVVVSTSRQPLMVRTEPLSIQWIPPGQGRRLDPSQFQIGRSAKAEVGFVPGFRNEPCHRP